MKVLNSAGSLAGTSTCLAVYGMFKRRPQSSSAGGNPVCALFVSTSMLTAVFHTHTEPLSLAVAMLPEPSAVHTRSRMAPSWLSITADTRPLPAATLQAAAHGTHEQDM
jgi:hypothetical protein